jgi:hypothetical protein
MPRSLRLLAFGLVLLAAGCRTCDDRPRPLQRLRDAFDRDDDRDRPVRPRTDDRLGSNLRPTAPGTCDPCATGGAMPVGRTTGGFGGEVIYGGMTTGMVSGPTLGTPVYPGGAGTVLPGTYRRDDELPPPGGYSQPGAVDMGRGGVPRPATSLTGR